MPFGEHEDGNYGEVRLTIEPNRELRGRILLYGENLEIISPMSLFLIPLLMLPSLSMSIPCPSDTRIQSTSLMGSWATVRESWARKV